MKIKTFTVLLFFCFISCNNKEAVTEMTFDKTKWATKEGTDFPYRNQMLTDVVYNDTIRTLSKNEILNLLGEPSYYRKDKNFLHYIINQKRIFSWPLQSKIMVVKFSNETTMEWIKIHE